MTAFDVRVEVAFDSGYSTPAASRTWTDVTPKLEAGNPFTITRGRQDNRSSVAASSLTGVVLNNTDGRFTPELTTGTYYPNVKRGRPIRVRVRYPSGQAGNFLTANQASMETSIADWTTFGVTPTLSWSNVRADNGTRSLLITWPTTSSLTGAITTCTGLTAGRTYTARARAYVPTGSVGVFVYCNGFSGSSFSTKDAWVTVSVTFTATASSHVVRILAGNVTTAGMQAWVDSVVVEEGSSVPAFTTNPPPIIDRFTGYVDEWAVSWPEGGDTHATCVVSATSRMARLANAAALRSIIAEEYALDAPEIHYQLGEPEGSTSAGNVSDTAQNPLTVAQAGTGGTLDFGLGTGPGTDSLTAPVFARASAGNGKYLTATLQNPLTGFFDSVLSMDVFFNTSTAAVQTLVGVYANPSNYLLLSIDATGKLEARAVCVDATGTQQTRTVTSAGSVSNGATHHGAIRVALTDGGTPTATVSVVTDGVVVTGATIPWATFANTTFFPTYTQIVVGGPLAPTLGDVFNGTLSHVGVYVQTDTGITDARFLAHFNAGNNGFSGETAQARITRYASYLGVPAAEIGTETGLLLGVPHVDTTDASALDLMQRVTTSEFGLLFDDPSGNLTFHARSHRYNAASALTLDVSAQEVEADFAPKLDDQGLLNDLTASRPSGIAIRSIDAASIADNGYFRDSLELLTTSDAEVQSAADWRVAQFGTPRMKAPSLAVDLVTFPTVGKIATILGVDLGTKVTTTNLPAQAQASSFDAFIEGVAEVIGIGTWATTWNVSPATSGNVWQLDSASYSQLDSTTVLAY